MARLLTHTLAYAFERILERRLRSAKIPRPKALVEDIVPQLMDEVPLEAFEARDPADAGYLFFHGAVEEERVVKVQEAILETHLNAPKNVPLTLYLSSVGGDVFGGLALCSTLQEVRRSGRIVNVHIQGCAMSMGSLIAQVCDNRSIEAQAWFMLHELRHFLPDLKTAELRDEMEFADRLEQQTFALYSARTGRPVEYWRKKLHRRDWFLTADEALAEGLVDEIKPVPPYARRRRRASHERLDG